MLIADSHETVTLLCSKLWQTVLTRRHEVRQGYWVKLESRAHGRRNRNYGIVDVPGAAVILYSSNYRRVNVNGAGRHVSRMRPPVTSTQWSTMVKIPEHKVIMHGVCIPTLTSPKPSCGKSFANFAVA